MGRRLYGDILLLYHLPTREGEIPRLCRGNGGLSHSSSQLRCQTELQSREPQFAQQKDMPSADDVPVPLPRMEEDGGEIRISFVEARSFSAARGFVKL
jgi:hypothetical protein